MAESYVGAGDPGEVYISMEDLQSQPELLQKLGARTGDVIYISQDADGQTTLQIERGAEQGQVLETETVPAEEIMQDVTTTAVEGGYQVEAAVEAEAPAISYETVQEQSAEMEFLTMSDPSDADQAQWVSILKPKEQLGQDGGDITGLQQGQAMVVHHSDVTGVQQSQLSTIQQSDITAIQHSDMTGVQQGDLSVVHQDDITTVQQTDVTGVQQPATSVIYEQTQIPEPVVTAADVLTNSLNSEIVVENRPYTVKQEKYFPQNRQTVRAVIEPPQVPVAVEPAPAPTVQMADEALLGEYLLQLAQSGGETVTTTAAAPAALVTAPHVMQSADVSSSTATQDMVLTTPTGKGATAGDKGYVLTGNELRPATEATPSANAQELIFTNTGDQAPLKAVDKDGTIYIFVPEQTSVHVSEPQKNALVNSAGPAISSRTHQVPQPANVMLMSSDMTRGAIQSPTATQASTVHHHIAQQLQLQQQPAGLQSTNILNIEKTPTGTVVTESVIPDAEGTAGASALQRVLKTYATARPVAGKRTLISLTSPESPGRKLARYDTAECESCSVTFKPLPNITNKDYPLCLKCEISKRKAKCLGGEFEEVDANKSPGVSVYSTMSFSCPKCPKKFCSRDALSKHDRTHTPAGGATQERLVAIPSSASPSVSYRNTHTARLTTPTYTARSVRSYSPRGGRYAGKKSKLHKCWCDPRMCFVSNVHLQRHAISAHIKSLDGRCVPCIYCGEKYEDIDALRWHVQEHDPVCGVCKHVFQQKSAMEGHVCEPSDAAEEVSLAADNTICQPGETAVRTVVTSAAPSAAGGVGKTSAPATAATAGKLATSELSTTELVVSLPQAGPDTDAVTGYMCHVCRKMFCSQEFLDKHMLKHDRA